MAQNIKQILRKLLSDLKKTGATGEQLANIETLLAEYEIEKNKKPDAENAKLVDADGKKSFKLSQDFEKIAKSYSENAKILKETVDISAVKYALAEKEKQTLREIVDLEIAAGNLNSEKKKIAQKRLKALTKKQKAEEDYQQGLAKGEEAAKLLLQRTLGLSTEWNKLGSVGGAKGFAGGLAGGLKALMNPIAILAAVASKVMASAMAAQKSSSDLFKRTGLTFGSQLETTKRLRAISIKLKGMTVNQLAKTAAALGDFQEGYGDFQSVFENEHLDDLARTITSIKEMGASGTDLARTFGALTKVYGMAPKQAGSMMNNFVGISDVLGRPVKEIYSSFLQAQPILARFEKTGIDIFRDISTQATKLEVDVGKLLSFEESMDTYEGAAKAAQAFNIAFGQPLINAQELLAADHGKRAAIIAKAYKKSGVEMSDRMIRGLSQDVGRDIPFMQRILKGGGQDMTELKDKVAGAQVSLLNNIKSVTNNQSLMDKMMAQMQNIISNIAKAVGADSGLAYATNLLSKIAITLFGDKEEKLAKIAAEGGLVEANTIGGGQFRKLLTVKDAKKEKEEAKTLLEIHKKLKSGEIDFNRGADGNQLTIRDGAQKQYIFKQFKKMYEGKLSEATFRKFERFKNKAFTHKATNHLNLEVESLKKIRDQTLDNIVDFQKLQERVKKETGKEIDFETFDPNRNTRNSQIYVIQADNSLIDDNLVLGPGDFKKPKPPETKVEPQNDAMATPVSVSSNYVQPVFHKQDKFYAAKEGGVIAKALDGVLAAVDKLIDQKQDLNLSIKERELVRAVNGAYDTVHRSTR